ncbi:peptidylprolyl isomerase [Qipengyuania citrea]|uniref:Parvulin-like PPIase n=2 Tax=Qipengyuania TaxID=1855416 RepID=A0ABY4U7C4_9SPHN|nr:MULTISPECIES: peptidylprolyl isomerase [Erythrobacteraceae]MCH2495961.1 peptidylprolyl isomerase [Erythrobacter sp.]MEC7889340.1 peptidylprolyl isomerase [Pseudomonadota bacterium]MEC7951577.1 peptidylprolyl isomerase [Pseudomonadota bacterium]MEE2794882.1 peptidylprolyl isomerase [Pseudomonadota bacterium]USA61983.1 peptidylprolyl isomerase [Qipengyuania citrea]
MTANIISRLLSAAAAAGLATAPIAGQAQDAMAQGDLLGLPSDLSMLTNSDPNKRVATAVVNGFVITQTDIDQRVALLLAANERPVSEQEMIRVRMQVLRNLIDETLQIQAALSQEIEVSQAEVDQTYARVAAQNFGQEPGKMDDYLTSIGSSPAALKRQITGELAWNNLLRRNVAPFVNISTDEVNEMIERMEASRGTEEYRLGEIYLSATPETSSAVEDNARKIVEQLRQGGSFVAYARQFSEASTAAVGGDLGWIQLPQLKNEQLEQVASEMTPGQLVGPIAIPGGYSILYLIDRRQVLMADPRDAVLSLKQIQIGFDPGTTEAAAQQRVARFTEGVQKIRGCGDAENVAAELGANVVTNDQIRVRALPEQLQNIILQLQVGQSTPPFGSFEEGVRVLMLCGRDDPKSAAGPDFNQIMGQLEEDRIEKRAQRYLRDLRNDAYIEYN